MRGRIDTNSFDDGMVDILDKLLEYKCFKTQHKIISVDLKLIYMFELSEK